MPKRDGLIAVVLGLITVGYTWGLLSAIEVLPVPLAVLVFYLFPIFTTFIVAAMGWEKLHRINVIAAFVAFAGLALALGVSGKGLNLTGGRAGGHVGAGTGYRFGCKQPGDPCRRPATGHVLHGGDRRRDLRSDHPAVRRVPAAHHTNGVVGV